MTTHLRLAVLPAALAAAWVALAPTASAQPVIPTDRTPRLQAPTPAVPGQPGTGAATDGSQQPGVAPAVAPGAEPREMTSLVLGVRASAAYSDNIDLRSKGNESAGGLFELTPYVQGTLRSARSEASVAYRARGLMYTGSDLYDRDLRNDLRARGDFALSEQSLRLAAEAYVFDTNVTPFGTTSLDPSARSSVRTQYRNVGLNPYFVGRLTPTTDYDLQYRLSYVDPGSAMISNVGHTVAARLGSTPGLSSFGWSLRTTGAQFDYDNNFSYRMTMTEALAYYSPAPLLRFGLGPNYSSNNALANSSGETGGAGVTATVDWLPDPRTEVSVKAASTYYTTIGTGRLSHREGRMSYGLGFTRNVSDGNQASLLYYDPARLFRTPGALPTQGAFDRSRLDQSLLGPTGTPLAATSTFSPIVLNRAVVGSVGYDGTRNAVLVTGYLNYQRALVTPAGFPPAYDYDQTGASFVWSYRLDTLSDLAFGTRYQLSESPTLDATTRLMSSSLSWSRRLSRELGVQAFVRWNRQRSDGTATAAYDERVIGTAIDYRF